MSDGRLNLTLTDVRGRPLTERVDVLLRNEFLHETLCTTDWDASRRIEISGLRTVPQGLYRMGVRSGSYFPFSRHVTVPAGGAAALDLMMALRPDRVTRIAFSPFAALVPDGRRLLVRSERVSGHFGVRGEALYSSLDDYQRAGLLNLFAKCEATVLREGNSVLSRLDEIVGIPGDRLFALAGRTFFDAVRGTVGAGIQDADETLTVTPASYGSYQRTGRYKTTDHYGSLRLAFFEDPRTNACLVQLDIDDARGLEQVFHVVPSAVLGPKHPFNVQQVLLCAQRLDPGYDLLCGATAAAAGG